ncbi:MAG: hypothetical protein M3118_01180 [Actinomycetota bacterium]|nr:hypothetical protein [Actinomycetota bacterium]
MRKVVGGATPDGLPGLLPTRPHLLNLRVTYATITAEGREALERARPAFREEIEERFAGHLNEEEIRTVRRAMRKVIRASGEEPLSEGTND